MVKSNDVLSTAMRKASLDFVAFDKPPDRVHMYSYFVYVVRENIFER